MRPEVRLIIQAELEGAPAAEMRRHRGATQSGLYALLTSI
jgi:hypothetical protein